MFSYYGSKSKIVDYYPPPKHKRIIEPFAGSARYSLKYWQNDVLLVDKYPVIVDVWNYLKNASEADIKGLPKLDTGQTIDDYDLSDIEKKFMGFMVQDGTTGMRRTASYFAVKRMDEKFNFIIENLHKIKHWEIKLGSYDELENIEATWFIDPPYEFGGHEYKCSNKNIDFDKLAEWVQGFGDEFQQNFSIIDQGPDGASLKVKTLEGISYDVSPSDVIIRGVKGEYYPCKKDIFEQTYDKL